MSTYYYMVCDKHMERTDAASRSAGGIGPLCDSPHTLLPFIVDHAGCPVRIVSEHERDSYEDRFEDWTAANVDDMMGKDRPVEPFIESPTDAAMRQFTALPKPGTPAAQLTDRDKLAVAVAAGVPTEVVKNAGIMTLRSKVPFAVADRGDGGYYVAVGRATPAPDDAPPRSGPHVG